MGTDIFGIIERRQANGEWVCYKDWLELDLYRYTPLFFALFYGDRTPRPELKPLRDWVATLSTEARSELFEMIEQNLTDCSPLFNKSEFDYDNFISVLDGDDDEPVMVSCAERWLDEGKSFPLTDNIISSPDYSYWNWLSADELDACLDRFEKDENCCVYEIDPYRIVATTMRELEDQGAEVRFVYCFTQAEPWTDLAISENLENCPLETEDGEDEPDTEERPNNYLLMYLLQCRAKEFIRTVEEINHKCFMGIYSLYKLAYANYILLSDEDFHNREFFDNVVIPCRAEAKAILKYLEGLIRIPLSFEDDFRKEARGLTWFYDDDDFEWMLDGSLEQLLEKGYREIDCRLYAAGMKLDYAETERLLKLGANPDITISGYLNCGEPADPRYMDVHRLSSDVSDKFGDAIDCYDLNKYWASGVEGKDMFLDENQTHNVLQGAAFRLMYLLIQKYTTV